MSAPATETQLVVFSDDWGRHPSSCQHLIAELLSRHPVLWVNTIGTRPPTVSWDDLKKVMGKLREWTSQREGADGLPANLAVISPRMYPGFRKPWQRRANANLIARAVHQALGPRQAASRRVAVTTLPVTADLPGLLDVDRWVYYCVDDFSVWPGLDAAVMQEMERQLVERVDAAVAVSETLRDRLAAMGCDATLLTHGIDLDHWRASSGPAGAGDGRSIGPADVEPPRAAPPPGDDEPSDNGADPLGPVAVAGDSEVAAGPAPVDNLPAWWPSLDPPVFLFWGLIDQRLDVGWCRHLSESISERGGRGTLVLVGPTQAPDPALETLGHVVMPGPVRYEALPAVARAASVLVMPYADLPVTRAMQPLKLKEYLAAGRAVVVRALPATRPWSDAADVVDSAEGFVEACWRRAEQGLPADQATARRRLAEETWARKARALEAVLLEQPAGSATA